MALASIIHAFTVSRSSVRAPAAAAFTNNGQAPVYTANVLPSPVRGAVVPHVRLSWGSQSKLGQPLLHSGDEDLHAGILA